MTTANEPIQTVAQQAIATQQPPAADLQPGEVVPEVLHNATPAPNAFADEDSKLEALEAEQSKLDADAKAAADAKAKADGTANITQSEPAAGAEPAAGTPAAAAPAKTGQEAAATASKNTVESALIALRRANSALKMEKAALVGENTVLKTLVQPGGAAAPAGEPDPAAAAQPSIEDQFAAIDAEYTSIAAKVDNGELSMTDAEKQRQAIRVRERQLTDDRAVQIATEAAVQNSAPVNDLGLQEHLNTLVEDYPVLKTLSKDELLPIEDLAYRNAEKTGNPIPQGPLGTKRLREAMAVIAERNYDPKAAEHAAARAARKTGAAPGAGGQPQALGGAQPGPVKTQPTAQQREAKLRDAGNMPPDIGDIGAGANGGEISEAQAEQIINSFRNEDELIRWLDLHPQFVEKTMGRSMRLTR